MMSSEAGFQRTKQVKIWLFNVRTVHSNFVIKYCNHDLSCWWGMLEFLLFLQCCVVPMGVNDTIEIWNLCQWRSAAVCVEGIMACRYWRSFLYQSCAYIQMRSMLMIKMWWYRHAIPCLSVRFKTCPNCGCFTLWWPFLPLSFQYHSEYCTSGCCQGNWFDFLQQQHI